MASLPEITAEITSEITAEITTERSSTKHWLIGLVLVFVTLIGVGIYAYSTGASLESLATLGYPGIFILMLISGSTIIVPLPTPAAVVAAGAIWNPALVGISAGFGNATAELVSYAAGKVAASTVHDYKHLRLVTFLHSWLQRHGFLTILVLAAIPNPIFHILSILAGSLGYPPRRFWLACVIGNSAKYIAMAYLGQTALPLILQPLLNGFGH
jgi:uncharacterized membrane protein YdjX (TVP38/TMEM64 family)